MTVLNSDLVPLKPRSVSNDPATNGGRISTTQIINNQPENVFHNITSAQRATGLTTWRKVFIANHNTANEAGLGVLNFIFAPTSGDDYVCFAPSDAVELQQDIDQAARKYGVMVLSQSYLAGDSTITCTLENEELAASDNILAIGDTLHITEKTDYFSALGNAEENEIDSFSVSGVDVTIQLKNPLTFDFQAGSKVATCWGNAAIVSSIDSAAITLTSSGGALLAQDDNITTTNKGAVTMLVTVLFLSDTTFSVTSDDPMYPGMGSGNISTDFVFLHPLYGVTMLEIKSALWDGTFAAGDEVQIPVVGSYVSVFEKRVVPASCPPMSLNSVSLVLKCES